MTAFRLLVVAAALALSPIGDAASVITSVPPAQQPASTVARKAAPALVAPAARALRIALPEPAAAERAKLQQKQVEKADVTSKRAPLAIGFAREVPAGSRVLQLAQLDWQAADGGGRTARIEVKSSGAAGVRLGLAMGSTDPDVSIRFAGSAPGAAVHGPFPANVIAASMQRLGQFVTPVLEGDTAIVELHAGEEAVLADGVLALGPVSHLVVAGAALERIAAKDVRDLGSAGSCNIDTACVQPQSDALRHASDSVGKLVFSDRDGFSYACSGTLMNDSRTSFTPYVLTAAHCISSAYEAATADVFWFFKAQSCSDRQVPPYVQQTGGAALLAASVDWDWSLLRLFDAPPAGTFFAAWRAEPLPQLAVATALHHPQGDLQKWSQGSALGYREFDYDDTSFVRMQWSQGTTEVGSSGSGLFTYLPEGDYYELRGGLFGGDASCSNRTGSDYYSRLDKLLPLVRQYLTPDSPGMAGESVVVEYYHRGLDHYFMTMDPGEIEAVDAGIFGTWERTGVRFLAYSTPVPGASPVCRFYLKPEYGNSHFYTADPGECEFVRRAYADAWVFESGAVFWIRTPDLATGACPAGTRPLWRFFNPQAINHRYTPEVAMREAMRNAPGTWMPEGYGPGKVIFCAHDGEAR